MLKRSSSCPASDLAGHSKAPRKWGAAFRKSFEEASKSVAKVREYAAVTIAVFKFDCSSSEVDRLARMRIAMFTLFTV